MSQAPVIFNSFGYLEYEKNVMSIAKAFEYPRIYTQMRFIYVIGNGYYVESLLKSAGKFMASDTCSLLSFIYTQNKV